jgi:DNA polymerase-1
LIGGFALACRENVLIVTSDKDLSQLINDRISILAPAKGSSSGFVLRQETEVFEKFGVKPELVADYLALVGDSSDNIPGVPGIGPKSAAALLNQFGPIESWGEHFEKLAGSKFAAKLNGNEELLRKNLILVRLKTELPEQFKDLTTSLARRSPDWQKIAELCKEYAFNAILKDLPCSIETETAETPAPSGEPEQLDLFAALSIPEEVPAPPQPEPADDEPEQGLLF